MDLPLYFTAGIFLLYLLLLEKCDPLTYQKEPIHIDMRKELSSLLLRFCLPVDYWVVDPQLIICLNIGDFIIVLIYLSASSAFPLITIVRALFLRFWIPVYLCMRLIIEPHTLSPQSLACRELNVHIEN